MTKLIWKRTPAGNAYLAHWELQVLLVEWFDGSWSFTTISPLDGSRWGPKFAVEADARKAAEAAFFRACEAHDWASLAKARVEDQLAAETAAPRGTKERPSLWALEEVFRGAVETSK